MAFTYIIGWRNLDRWYYGYSTKSPDALWTKYFTSSKVVKAFRSDFGDPDVIRIHRVFDTKQAANEHEIKFLKRVGAVKSDRWLNRHDTQNFRGPSTYTAASREKMSAAKKGRVPWNKGKGGYKQSPESVAKRAAANRGKKRSAEACQNISAAKKGMKISEATLAGKDEHFKQRAAAGLPGYRKGSVVSEEQKAKISASRKGQPAWNKGMKRVEGKYMVLPSAG